MRVLVHEYVVGGGLGTAEMATSLRQEGEAMWAAVVEDFAAVPGVVVSTLRDGRLPSVPTAAQRVWTVEPGEELTRFRHALSACDAVLIIAPEFAGILAERVELAQQFGVPLLGTGEPLVTDTADKWLTYQRLRQAGFPRTPETTRLAEFHSLPTGHPARRFPLVLKPRDGAGSQATFRIGNPMEFQAVLGDADYHGWEGDFLVQPFVPGLAASVAMLCGPNGGCWPLLPTRQLLSEDDRFRYLGGELPLPDELAARAERLARHVYEALPGLLGYVGVDVVLGTREADDTVIEVNPRLTTSYVGLRAASRVNLAEQLIRAVRGQPVELAWRLGRVRFRSDGCVLREEPR